MHKYDDMIHTGVKALKAAEILQLPVYVTEQNPKGEHASVVVWHDRY